ncbi:MAG: YueI family protein [Bacillaceae bacterium]
MYNKKIDDYLNEGIYGAKEINPAEKKMYLGTFRERIYKALTIAQTMRPIIYKEIIDEMKKQKNCTLLLNGGISYSYLSPYIKQATAAGIPFSIVQNLNSDTSIGLVLASSTAVELENIYIQDDLFRL